MPKQKTLKKTVDIPTLNEVVVAGKPNFSTEEEDAPLNLTAQQVQSLEQQITQIVETRLQGILDQAVQMTVKEIKAYLAQTLPQLLATQQQSKQPAKAKAKK